MRTTPVLSGRDILTGTSIVVGKNTVTTLGRVILDTATRAFTAERVFTEVEWGFHEAALAVAVIVAKYGGRFSLHDCASGHGRAGRRHWLRNLRVVRQSKPSHQRVE